MNKKEKKLLHAIRKLRNLYLLDVPNLIEKLNYIEAEIQIIEEDLFDFMDDDLAEKIVNEFDTDDQS